jgi:hypothetical protein
MCTNLAIARGPHFVAKHALPWSAALRRILGKLNSLDAPPLMSFADFAVIVMFDCMWKNRQDEFDPLLGRKR